MRSLDLQHGWLLGLTLDAFSHHLQKDRTSQACFFLAKFELEARWLGGDHSAALIAKTDGLEAEIGCGRP